MCVCLLVHLCECVCVKEREKIYVGHKFVCFTRVLTVLQTNLCCRFTRVG